MSGGSGGLVKTKQGLVRGARERAVYAWKGIPYALPPIGKYRFKPPHPPEPWDGIRDAARYGAVPCQSDGYLISQFGEKSYVMSEDCLNLNIWSPAADGGKRPVLVWFYGGSYVSGTANAPLYNGASFAERGDLVFVGVNYRLGILGFLHLGEIAGEEYAASGNNGLLDQIAALEWIRDNIEAFGGDPDRVTIFGESAGAASVATLMAMPKARGLFHRGIMQSGSHKKIIDVETAAERARWALRQLNIPEKEWERLLLVEAERLVELTAAAARQQVEFIPLVDGVSLPEHPLTAYGKGAARDIPVMMGTTLDEMRLMYVYDPHWADFPDDEAALEWFDRRFGPFPDEIKQYYVHLDMPGEPFAHKLIAMLNYKSFELPMQQIARRQLAHGAPVWLYRFDWRGTGMNGLLGACHASELPYVFNNLDAPRARILCGDRMDGELALRMHRAWIAFARSGDPNTPDLPHWPPYDLQTRARMIFDTNSEVRNDPYKEERLLWEAHDGMD